MVIYVVQLTISRCGVAREVDLSCVFIVKDDVYEEVISDKIS